MDTNIFEITSHREKHIFEMYSIKAAPNNKEAVKFLKDLTHRENIVDVYNGRFGYPMGYTAEGWKQERRRLDLESLKRVKDKRKSKKFCVIA